MKISMLKQQVQQKTGLQDFRLVYRNQELTLNSNDLEVSKTSNRIMAYAREQY